VDAEGVSLAAIQGLAQVVEDQDAQIAALQAQQSAALEARVTAIERSAGTENSGTPPGNAGLPLAGWPLVGVVAAGLAVVARHRAGG
jgi:hypothetical protein